MTNKPKYQSITILMYVLSFFLIHLTINATIEESKQAPLIVGSSGLCVVIKENFKEITNRLMQNSPDITSLEFSFTLTEDEIKELYDSIKNNYEIGYISWQSDQFSYPALKEIETKLMENNQNYQYFPNDYIHVLLAVHAYKNSEEGDFVELNENVKSHLQDWQVAKVYDDTEDSGYYAAIYKNDKNHQIVLAIRGTEGIVAGLLKNNSDLKTDLEEIVAQQIVIGQQAYNYKATYETINFAKEKGYKFSITGHSLGAWLAELSAFYCHAYFNYRNIKAVTFDSPGTVPMINKLQSNIESKDTQVDVNDIEIVTYLSMPNFVNCCNQHLGKVYRIAPEMKWIDWTKEKVPNFIQKIIGTDKIDAILSIQGHFLAGILETFNSETGKPKQFKRMIDWPRMEYKGEAKNFLHPSKISSLMKLGLTLGLDYLIGDMTIMTIVKFLKNLPEINQEQYWSYFQYIDSEENNKDAIEAKEKINYDDRFALTAKAKYREGDDINILILEEGSIDEHLYKLWAIKDNVEQLKCFPEILENQFKALLSIFSIEQISDSKYTLMPKLGYNIEDIRSKTRRLLHVVPTYLWNRLDKMEINKRQTIFNLADDVKIIDKLMTHIPENLPLEVPYYLEVKREELENDLKNNQIVIIAGAGGMGKTTLAAKYAIDYSQKEGYQVLWINGQQIEEEFFHLAKVMQVEIENQRWDIIKNLVYCVLEKYFYEKQILFIFDNVTKKERMEDYLANLPPHAKIIITTRNPDILIGRKVLEIEEFKRKEAIIYLKNGLGKDDKELEKLVDIIGTLPFRLFQVIAYLKNHDLLNVDEFIDKYRKIKSGLEHSEEIYPAVDLLFGDLKKKSLASWQLLKHLAYLHPEGIAVSSVLDIMEQNKDELQESINQLEQLSLVCVKYKNDQTILATSPTVQEETKKALLEEEKAGLHDIAQNEILEKLIKILDQKFPFFDENQTMFDGKKTDLISHVKNLIAETKNFRSLYSQRNSLLLKLGSYYYQNFKYREAICYWEELYIEEKKAPTASQDLFLLLNKLGIAYQELEGEENIKKALSYFEEAIKIEQSSFSQNYPDRVLALINLGNAYQKLKDEENIKKGLAYLEESLSMAQEQLPKKSNELIKSLNNLGIAYKNLGGENNIYKALSCIEESVKISQESFPDDYCSLASAFNNLGNIYCQLGGEDNKKGLIYLEESLKIYLKLFPNNHPMMANALNSLGVAYQKMNDVNKALEYWKQSLGIYSSIFSEDYQKAQELKLEILSLQPNFFEEQDYNSKLQNQECAWANKVGSEYRKIIFSRGKTNNSLINLKQRIQGSVLNHIVKAIDDHGWTDINWFWKDDGVKGYIEKDYLGSQLKELFDDDNLVTARMLCFEAMNLGIMRSQKKPYSVVECFTKTNPELVKKVAKEHPEFFVDGSIVEACLRAMPNDQSFQKHILDYVKYMGMKL